MAKTGETAKTPGTDVAAPEPKSVTKGIDSSLLLQDAAEDLGFRKEDVAVPFIKVLQKMSPELSKQNAKYVTGAEEGDFYNSVTGKVYKGGDGIVVIPCLFTPSYIEWRPRDSGGGMVTDHGADSTILKSCVRNEKKKLVTPQGNHLVQSAMYYCLLWDDNKAEQVVVSLFGTQLKKGRRWNSLISTLNIPHPSVPGQTLRAPIIYEAYKITTVPEKNDQGEWMGVKIDYFAETVSLGGPDLYMMARNFRQLVGSGTIKADVKSMDMSGAETEVEIVDDGVM